MRATGGFACATCGKPLGARRVRQGLSAHPACRRALPREEVERALGLAQAALARLHGEGSDDELRRLCADAAAQAAALIDDLKRLRGYVGGAAASGDEAGAPSGSARRSGGEPGG